LRVARYGLAARKFLELSPDQRRRLGGLGGGVLDLSCVRHMINAAEPVR